MHFLQYLPFYLRMIIYLPINLYIYIYITYNFLQGAAADDSVHQAILPKLREHRGDGHHWYHLPPPHQQGLLKT